MTSIFKNIIFKNSFVFFKWSFCTVRTCDGEDPGANVGFPAHHENAVLLIVHVHTTHKIPILGVGASCERYTLRPDVPATNIGSLIRINIIRWNPTLFTVM